MYLHIGKEIVINEKNIIAMFNLNYIQNTKEYRKLYEDLEKKRNLIKISEKENKTFILVKEKEEIKGYITNIGTNTIGKRKM